MFTAVSVIYAAIKLVLETFYWLLIARAVLSWLPINGGKIMYFVYTVTEAVLAPVRRGFEKITGRSAFPIDWSALAVLMALTVLLNIF